VPEFVAQGLSQHAAAAQQNRRLQVDAPPSGISRHPAGFAGSIAKGLHVRIDADLDAARQGHVCPAGDAPGLALGQGEHAAVQAGAGGQ